MTRRDEELTPAELEAEDATALPDREAMSTLDPTAGLDPATSLPTELPELPDTELPDPNVSLGAGLLDLDVNVDLDADAAAPVSAAVAANANIAAPIDAAVSANIASPDATSAAVATQNSTIVQQLDGTAIADVDQTSDIGQGEVAEGSGSGAAAEADAGGSETP
jgi:hypothetical protein